MNKSNNSRSMVLCVGFIVLVFVSLVLFWGRFFFKLAMLNVAGTPSAKVQPSGLVDEAIENDLNTKPSEVTFMVSSDEMMFSGLGLSDYFINNIPFDGVAENYFYRDGGDKTNVKYAVYYDKELRQFVCCDLHFAGGDDGRWVKKILYYAGPEGVAKKKDDKIGQFVKPVYVSPSYGERVFYDEGLRRFFRLDYSGKRQISKKGPDGREIKEWVDREIVVFMGKPLAEDTWRRPVSCYRIDRSSSLHWMAPSKQTVKNDDEGGKIRRRNVDWSPINVWITPWSSKFMPVVDATGRIDLLDRNTLEFAGNIAGKLPPAPEFYGHYGPEDIRANDLYGFDIIVFSDPNSGEYKGIAVGSVAKDINGVALAVYDAKGRPFRRITFNLEMLRPGVMRAAWGPMSVICHLLSAKLQQSYPSETHPSGAGQSL